MDDYWGPGKKLLGDPKIVEGLLQVDKDNIPARASKQIAERVLSDETFDPEKLKSVSVVAEGKIINLDQYFIIEINFLFLLGLSRWVIALYNYDLAAKLSAPKKQALAEATEDLQTASTALEVCEAADI